MQAMRFVEHVPPRGPTVADVYKAPGQSWEDVSMRESHRKTQSMWQTRLPLTRSHRAAKPDFDSVARLEEAHTADAMFPEAPPVEAPDPPLRFYGYFRDHQWDDPVAGGIRRVVIVFFPEDGTLMISEPKTPGPPPRGGTLLKRHVALLGQGAPGATRGRPVTVAHLNVGLDLVLYGRKYHLVDCDRPARDYLRRQRITVPPAQPYPEEADGPSGFWIGGQPPTHRRQVTGTTDRAPESSLGWGSPVRYPVARPRRPPGEDDGAVLRFSAAWDCRGTGGDLLQYTLKFFPTDSTFVLSEELPPNAGVDPFRLAMARCRLPKGDVPPKNTPFSHGPPTAGAADFYQAADLGVGQTVVAWGRRLLLYDADGFTRDWYRRTLRSELRPRMELLEDNAFSTRRKPVGEREEPPAMFTAFGSEEDVLHNRHRLVLKPPLRDVRHWDRWASCILRFSAQRHRPPTEEEASRRFVITFYMTDGSVQVAETTTRNSGRSSGRLLRRQKVKKTSGEGLASFYQWDDFHVGAVVKLCGYGYEVVGLDPATLRFRYHRDRLPPGVTAEAFEDALDRWGVTVDEHTSLSDAIGAGARCNLGPEDEALVNFLTVYNADHGQHVLVSEFLTAVSGDLDRAMEEAAPRPGDETQLAALKEERRQLVMTLKAAELVTRAFEAEGLSPQDFFSLIAQLPCTRKATGALSTGGLQAKANRFQFLSGCRHYLRLQLETPELEGLLGALFPESRPSLSGMDFTAALAQWQAYGALPPLRSQPPLL
eukprot:EG_transcript_2604